MFKLESYITPIILSYVEKYAKNLKAEHSQFSLWGGDAVFSNLDLRLDVLERELNIPFSFVSGHIHELHIHVPWTRLHAEPILITINTIECVLKLPSKEERFESSERPLVRAKKRQDDKVPPPGYVQSLINKIISNVSVVCNNLIFKYVEEDIVLSLNTRSVKLSSADGDWSPSFAELSMSDLILRKILSVSDLTICLDKRNASGKIECYQEPLLYRCSLDVRAAWSYDSLHSKTPRMSRLEVHSPSLEFSVTETQMPMLLRLAYLVLALYNGKIGHQVGLSHVEDAEVGGSEDFEEGNEGDSWSGWAWNVGANVGSALLPIYWEEDSEDEDGSNYAERNRFYKLNKILHLGFYVESSSIDLKLTEVAKEKRFFGTASHKQCFTPYCKFNLHGIFGEVRVKGINSVNFRGGINFIEVNPLGYCPCEGGNGNDEDFYIYGGFNKDIEPENKTGLSYATGSFFENNNTQMSEGPSNEKSSYDVSWETHMETVTEEVMLERTQAIAVDYLYYLEIPSDWSSEQLSDLGSDLEYSNLSERALFRVVLGPFKVKVTSGFMHRLEMVKEALQYYDYSPYYAEAEIKPSDLRRLDASGHSLEDEIDVIQNGSIPLRVYQLTAIQPSFIICAGDHKPRRRRQSNRNDVVLPAVRLSMGYLDLTYASPMYPRRCVSAVSTMSNPSASLLHSSCYSFANVNLLNIILQLLHGERAVTLLQPSKFQGSFKKLIFPECWDKKTLPRWECSSEVHTLKFRFTKPQILLLYRVLSSNTNFNDETSKMIALTRDSMTKQLSSFVFSFSGGKFTMAKTPTTTCLQFLLEDIGVCILPSDPNRKIVPILSHEKENDGNKTSPGRASIKYGSSCTFILQFPNDIESQSFNNAATIIYCNIAEFYINLDPAIYDWLTYSLKEFKSIEREDRSMNKSNSADNTEHTSLGTISSTIDVENSKDNPSLIVSFLKDWFPTISGSLVQAKIQSPKLFFPITSLSGGRSVKEAVKKANSSSVLVKISLPTITLENAAHIPVIQQFLTGFPILLPTTLWNPARYNLPIKIKLNDISISDEQSGLFFLEPNNLNCTLDLNLGKEKKFNVCVHVDASNPIKFVLNSEFLSTTTEYINKTIICFRSFYPITDIDEISDKEEPSFSPEPISSVRSQSGYFDSCRLAEDSLTTALSTDASSTVGIEENTAKDFISLWCQCTIPSIFVKCLSNDNNDTSSLTLELEDLTASLDVQPRYLKLKSRVMSVAMRTSDGDVIFSCGEDFTPEIMTTGENAVEILPHSRFYNAMDFDNPGIFNCTFTRALHFNPKWKNFIKKSKALDISQEEEDNECKILSEIDVKISAIDVVLFHKNLLPYMKLFSEAVSNLKLNFSERKKSPSNPTLGLSLNSSTLPLFHLKSKSIRIFCRNSSCHNLSEIDTILFHVEALSISSQVENALSRVLLRPDLYYLAEQCEVLNSLGSKIEDRQYCIFMEQIGIATGKWNSLIEKSSCANSDFMLKGMGENPALEWNTSGGAESSIDLNEPFFCPILKRFNLQITFAPAIVYYGDASSTIKSKKAKFKLIAGHSLEVNAISSVHVFLSIEQMALCNSFVVNACEALKTLIKDDKHSASLSEDIIIQDSGCESTTSQRCSKPFSGGSARLIPSEILITGSSLALSLYRKSAEMRSKLDEQDENGRRAMRRKNRYKNRRLEVMRERRFIMKEEDEDSLEGTLTCNSPPDLAGGYDASEEGSFCAEEPHDKYVTRIYPLVHVSLNQPHIVISLLKSSQKFECSFYDLTLRGSLKGNYVITGGNENSLPEVQDFSNQWIQTKPGDPDPNSGIPPALFTATLSDFYSSSPKASIVINRPVKLNINMETLACMTEISELVRRTLNLKDISQESPSAEDKTLVPVLLYLLNQFESVEFSTKQILTSLPIPNSSSEFFFNLSSFTSEMKSCEEESINLNISVCNLSIRAGIRGLTHRLLNPWSFNVSSYCSWTPWREDPIVYLRLESKCVVLDVGPNTVLALKAALEYMSTFTNGKNNEDHTSPQSWYSFLFVKGPSLVGEQHYADDLRAGAFKYITDSEDKGDLTTTKPYQVILTPNAMTWKYPQPRTLTRVTVFPVPFMTASKSGKDVSSFKKEVVCGLQFFDPSLKSFRTYSTFILSEHNVQHLNLPVLTDRKRIAISSVWRIVLDFEGESDEGIEDNSEGAAVIVTAKSLVSVIRVDSFFSPELIPKLQGCGFITSVVLRIRNHFHFFSDRFVPEIENYNLHQAYPLDQAICDAGLDSISFGIDIWNDKTFSSLLRVKSQYKLSFTDFRFLCEHFLIVPTKFQMQINVPDESSVDLSFHSKPLSLRYGHFIHRTLEISLNVWKSVLSSSNVSNNFVPILTDYAICNRSQCHLRFGQAETKENLLLRPQECYMYTWRSQKCPLLLKVGIKIGKNKTAWSGPFSFEYTDKKPIIRKTQESQPRVLVINFYRICKESTLQVIISGLISTASLLKEALDVKLVWSKVNPPVDEEEQIKNQRTILNPYTAAPSFIIDPATIQALKIRILGIGTAWSEDIPLSIDAGRRHSVIVRLPIKDKSSCLTLWCRVVTESFPSNVSRTLFIFSPMYVAKSLLPNPMTTYITSSLITKPFEVSLPGQDSIVQLETFGDDLKYQMTFKVVEGLPPSEPIHISWGMVEQLRRRRSAKGEDEEEMRMSSIDDIIREIPRYNIPKWFNDGEVFARNEQPKTDVQVVFEQFHPFCNTLCIEIRPTILIVNELKDKLLLRFEEKVWSILGKSYLVPPQLSSSFSFGIPDEDDGAFFGPELQLTDKDWKFRQLMHPLTKSIPSDGTLQIKIQVKQECICYLTLFGSLDSKRNIQVIRIKSTFNIINSLPRSISVASLSVGEGCPLWSDASFAGQMLPSSEDKIISLIYWQVLGSPGHQHLSFCMEEEDEMGNWSNPISLKNFGSEYDQRHFTSIPLKNSTTRVGCLPLVVTVHKREDQYYLTVNVEDRPFLMIHNNLFGKTLFVMKEQNSGEEESRKYFNTTPHVEPGRSTYISVYMGSIYFADNVSNFGVKFSAQDATSTADRDTDSTMTWSNGVKLETLLNEHYLRIPGYGDSKVTVESIGYTFHVFVDPVSHMEVSAKDIRARINHDSSQNEDLKTACRESVDSGILKKSLFSNITTYLPSEILFARKNKKDAINKEIIAYFYFEELSFTLSDDCYDSPDIKSEFTKLVLDSISLTFRPRYEKDQISLDGKISKFLDVSMTIFDLQMDNQMFKKRKYDFSVLCVGKQSKGDGSIEDGENYRSVRQRIDVPVSSRLEYVYDELKRNSLIHAELSFDINMSGGEAVFKSMRVRAQPMFVNVEDCFFYKISEVLSSFSSKLENNDKFPLSSILTSASNMRRYIRLSSVYIDPISVSISVRASVKMYISVHESPLNFPAFSKEMQTLTTPYALGQTIAHHYISGALFRAGWVVGSLDLIGSPTVLTKTVGNGIRDLITLPYEGSFQGPWAFISGVANGSSSLIKHITAGTITSVTNFASSVSRNLDRLSFDKEHRERNEIARRSSQPNGLGEGLLSGLSGVGIGILGAVGGIFHHPLQAIIEEGLSPTGLLSGMTRGIVGVVAKPLGGAAEFVALSGQGLLRGSGWSKDIHPRYEPYPEYISSFDSSELKYAWKLLDDWYDTTILSIIHASKANNISLLRTLLLTTEAIFIIPSDSTDPTVHPLTSLDIIENGEDPTKLTIIYNQKAGKEDNLEEKYRSDRIAQFVLGLNGREEGGKGVIRKMSDKDCAAEMSFLSSPRAIESFSACFVLAKRQISNKGFDSL